MANIIENFKESFRKATGMTVDEAVASAKRQSDVSNKSGKNVRFEGNVNLSDNYKNSLNDIVKFYQKEFKITPHATIHPFSDMMDEDEDDYEDTLGLAETEPDKMGQLGVGLRYLDTKGEPKAKAIAKDDVEVGWHPKNSGTINQTPTHELGHALFGTLFPDKNTSSNAKKVDIYKNGKKDKRLYGAFDLYYDSLNDLGISDLSADKDKVIKETGKISDYAIGSTVDKQGRSIIDPHEVIAESLVDYYYNRKKAAPLSQAIVKRLKNSGGLYRFEQAGGIDLAPTNDSFIKNLRRYNVVQ